MLEKKNAKWRNWKETDKERDPFISTSVTLSYGKKNNP
jgi:hypothetical protein